MTTYFISDIHGEWFAFQALLKHVNFDPTSDVLIVGGDMINRGPSSIEVITFIWEMQKEHPDNIIVLLGNHEAMMLQYYFDGDKLWNENDGERVRREMDQYFDSKSGEELAAFMDWVEGLPILHDDDKFIYTHAGINIDDDLDKQHKDIIWMNKNSIYLHPAQLMLDYTNGKIIVHGHIRQHDISFDGARINADVSLRGLALMDPHDMKYYYYDKKTRMVNTRKIQQK